MSLKERGDELVNCPVETGPIELSRCSSFAAKNDFPISNFHSQEGESQSSYTLKPGEKVSVTYKIGPKHLQFGEHQQFQPKVDIDTLTQLKVSTRSFRAQSGVFVYIDPEKPLTVEQTEAIARGEEIEVAGYLKNIGQSSQVFKAGDEVGRLYWTNEKELIKGDELQQLLDKGLVGPDSWHLVDDHTVAVMVADERFLVPNLPDGQPHRFDRRQEFGLFSGYTAGYTPESSSQLKTALETAGLVDSKHPFELLVTKRGLDLPGNVMGILLPETDLPGVLHYPSLLIDPLSKWPVRLEILGGHPKYVYFTFYRTDNCPARPASDVKDYNIYAKAK